VSRERLLVQVWSYASVFASGTLDTTIARLPAKLEPEPMSPRFILTHHGEGYALVRRLPRPGRPLMGREALLEGVVEWLAGSGPLTLAGPSGIGESGLLDAIADLPLGGRPIVFVDVPSEGAAGLAAAVSDAPRLVLADLGCLPPSAIDGLSSLSSHCIASQLVLDDRGERVVRVPPLVGRSPLAIAVEGTADAGLRLRENLESTLSLPSDRARAAWRSLLGSPDDDMVDELFQVGVVCWHDRRAARAPHVQIADKSA